MNFLEKLVRADEFRLTRFHTQAGAFCGARALPGLLPSGLTWIGRRAAGHYVERPWWVWEATRFVAKRLKRTDRVLEAGSGYSTLWLARRCAEVVSLEESAKWKLEVERKAEHSRLDNIKVECGNTIEMFRRTFSLNPDVVVIDNPGDRVSVFRHVLDSPPAHQPRMIIYDNSDRPGDRAAFGLPYGAHYEAFSFRGFGPQTVHVWETTVFVSRQPGGISASE